MLKFFSIEVYVLHDPGTNLSFLSPLVPKIFEIIPYILHEPFIVSFLVGELFVTKRVYKNFPKILHIRVSKVDIVKLDMLDFYFILDMD